MSGCKPGDLARVVGYNHCPENMGAIVHVIELIKPGQTYHSGNTLCRFQPKDGSNRATWLIEGVDRPLLAMGTKSRTKRVARFITKRDAHLEPLHPDENGVDETLLLAGLPSQPVEQT